MDRNAALAGPQLREPHKPVSPLAGDTSARPRPAGFWLRFWAWLYDTAILTIILAFLTVLVKVAFGIALVSFMVGLVERGLTGSFGALLAVAVFFLGWIVLALVLWFLQQLLGWLYYATFESGASRATPGKRLLALWVVDAQNQQISFGRATLRHVFKFAALFPAILVFVFLVGQLSQKGTATPATAAWLFVAALAAAPFLFFIFYGMAGWTRDRQALHDMLSGCYVVRSKELTSGQAFGLAIGGVTFLLVVWIATSLVGVYRSASAVEPPATEQRTTTTDTPAKPSPRVAAAALRAINGGSTLPT